MLCLKKIVVISREQYELEAAGWLRPADVEKVKGSK